MSPDFVRAHFYLGMAYVAKGVRDKGMDEYQTGMTLSGGTAWRPLTAFDAFMDVHCGRPAEARRVVKKLEEAPSSQGHLQDYYVLAQVEVALGDREAAFRDLAKAEQQNTNFLVC
jgi:hypothetical protein